MKLLSIKEYAVSHKLSIYNVVKMTKNGQLQTQTEKIEGKDEVFICVDEIEEVKPVQQEQEKIDDFEKAYYKLKLQYSQLKIKYENLQKKI